MTSREFMYMNNNVFTFVFSTTNKTFGPFSEWDFSPKKTFPRHVFSSLNIKKEKSSGILPTYIIAHSPIVHYVRYIN